MTDQGGTRSHGRASAADILRTLAALAPSGRRRQSFDVMEGSNPFVWLGGSRSTLAMTLAPDGVMPADVTTVTIATTDDARRLAAVDALHAEDRLVREGWVFLVGRATVDGAERQIFMPLISHPVRIRRSFPHLAVTPAGDAEMTPLITDPVTAYRLQADAQFGGGALVEPEASDELVARLSNLNDWIEAVTRAAGVTGVTVVGPTHDPASFRGGERLYAVVGAGLYVSRDINAVDVATTLTTWASQPGITATAFATLYGVNAAAPHTTEEESVRSPLPLTDAQQAVVAAARQQPITVVSGPPGCGKSHTLVATALDAVARGESVLIATQSYYAAEVLAGLLDRHPGPTPVLFGNAEHRERLTQHIETSLQRSDAARRVRELEHRAATAQAEVDLLAAQARELALREVLAAETDLWEATAALHSARFPSLFHPGAEPDAWAEAIDEVRRTHASGGWWARRRAQRRLRRLAGVREPSPEMDAAIRAARVRRAAVLLETSGGTRLTPVFDALARAERTARVALGELLAARASAQASGSSRSRNAVTALAGALRASRPRRRELLRRLDAHALVSALPLWVGTLPDIEHLLPVVPGLFDLVLLDEASQIDQRSAPPALLRARRAVIAGDPRQLRHVSFVGDEAVSSAIEAEGSGGAAHLLDVRRMSTFDIAAGAAAVHWLGDHFRSVPHLIEFSSQRFYEGRVWVLTRQPATEAADVIDVIRVQGSRDTEGVNSAEIDRVAQVVRSLAAEGASSIGVVTPFRRQADALERMLLADFELEDIERLGLRVGTVHQFQGNERDHIVVSLGISGGDPPGSRRFVEDPNLFNVMVTRARQTMRVVTSDDPEARTLIGAYLRYGNRGPQPLVDKPSGDAWVDALGEELARCGLQPRSHYPVGRWVVDIAVEASSRPVALDCAVDPAGPDAHIEKHRQLASAGWRFVDAYASRFGSDTAQAALTITHEIDAAANRR